MTTYQRPAGAPADSEPTLDFGGRLVWAEDHKTPATSGGTSQARLYTKAPMTQPTYRITHNPLNKRLATEHAHHITRNTGRPVETRSDKHHELGHITITLIPPNP